MIVDVHRHMWSAGERYREGGRTNTDFDWEETTRSVVEEMDESGVDRSVLLVADFADRRGDPPFTIHEENRFVAEARKRNPDRIIAFYGIDPRRAGAADSFERAIREWGVQGFKIHSSVGFYPHDRVCYPIYDLCIRHDLPVLFHVGPMHHPRLYSRFCHPLEFDQVAADFPNLTMIMGHAGDDWWSDCVVIARGHRNMVVDLSGWSLKLRDNPEESVYAINRMRNLLGVGRILWANDFPGPKERISLKECREVIERLPALGAKYGYTFSDADVQAILGANAQALLKLL